MRVGDKRQFIRKKGANLEAPSKEQIDQARDRIKTFSREAKADPAMVSRLKSDPVGTLTSAGVPQFAIGDFLREEGMEAEVGGYAASTGAATGKLAAAGCWISCACSACCISG
jgi:hypothetical protein